MLESLSKESVHSKHGKQTLTLPVSIPYEQKNIKLNIYFHISLWCLKRFSEGLKGLHKPFEGPQRCVKIKFNLIFISIQLSEIHGTLMVKQI